MRLITVNYRALTEKMSSINFEAFGVCTEICASDADEDDDDGETCFDVISESVENAQYHEKLLITTII